MRQRIVSILLLTIACATFAHMVFARPPGTTAGSYNCIVAGDFTGNGNVSISGSSITFSIQVRDKSGNTGTFYAQLNIVNNRFAGGGTVLGFPMRIQGRLDPADDEQRGEQLRGQRLVATFSDNQKHHGRISGSPKLRGNGNANGNANGNPNSPGAGGTGQDNGNGTSNGTGTGQEDDNGQGNGNGQDNGNGQGTGAGNGQGNGNGNGNGPGNNQGNQGQSNQGNGQGNPGGNQGNQGTIRSR